MSDQTIDVQAPNQNEQPTVTVVPMPAVMQPLVAATALAKMPNPVITREGEWKVIKASTGTIGISRVVCVGKIAWEQTQYAPKTATLTTDSSVEDVLSELKVQPRSVVGSTVTFKANGNYIEFRYGASMNVEEILEEAELARFDKAKETRRLEMIEIQQKKAEALAGKAIAEAAQARAEADKIAAEKGEERLAAEKLREQGIPASIEL